LQRPQISTNGRNDKSPDERRELCAGAEYILDSVILKFFVMSHAARTRSAISTRFRICRNDNRAICEGAKYRRCFQIEWVRPFSEL